MIVDLVYTLASAIKRMLVIMPKCSIKIISIILLAVPIVFHLFIVSTWAVNAPFYDDFEWGVVFLEKYLQANTFGDRLSLIFSQHNQHRVIWLRLSIISLHEIFGYLDFKYLVWIGNLSFFGLTTVLLFAFQKTNAKLIYALPLVFILHQFQSVHNIIVSYGVPNMSVIFFAVLSFFLVLCKNSKYLYWGLLAGFVASFSNGSGILVMPLMSIFAFSFLAKKHYYPVLITSTITLGIYFYGYQTNYSEITISLESLNYLFEFMAAYLPGSSSWLVKGSLFVVFVYLIYEGAQQMKYKNIDGKKIHLLSFLLCTSLFLGGAGLMATLFRLIHKLAIPNWYYIYSITFIAVVYLGVLTIFDKKKQRIFTFLFFLVLTSVVYFQSLNNDLVKMKGIASSLQADAANYKKNGSWAFLPGRMGKQTLNHWQNTYRELYKSKDVRLGQNVLDNITVDTHNKSLSTEIKVDSLPDHYFNITYIPSEFNNEMLSAKERYGFLKKDDDKKKYIIGVFNWPNTTFQTLKNRSFFNDNGSFIVEKKTLEEHIPAGRYYPGFVFIDKEGQVKQMWSKNQIEIKNW